ncbi:MAG: lipopolysaccharide biosynthesis protein [Phycisphaerales bacterium]
MPSEVNRGIIRLLTNYFRLFISVVFGLILVRLLLRSIGEDGWGVVALFGSTIGLAAMLQAIVRASMIRELGTAYHSGDDASFIRAYNSALGLAGIVAGFALIIFGLLFLFLPLFKLEGLEAGGKAMVVCGAFQSVTTVLCAPVFNMYLVSERMASHNIWLLLIERGSSLLAAMTVTFVWVSDDPNVSLMRYAIISSAAEMLCSIAPSLIMMLLIDKRTRPRPSELRWKEVRSIGKVSGWNAVVVIAMNLHLRVDAIIMNLAFGLFGSRIFGYAMQLTGYARRLAVGMTDGLDAVATRMSTRNTAESVRQLVRYSTRMHGVVTFPASALMIVLAEPIMQVWIGDLLTDTSESIRPTVSLILILIIGNGVRSISDAWVRILYGAGYIRSYAPAILIGGVANPITAIVLIWLLPKEPPAWNAVAWAFSGIMVVVHGIVVPFIAAGQLEMRFVNLFRPLVRPLLVTILCMPIPLMAEWWIIDNWNVFNLFAVFAVFGMSYAIATWYLTLYGDERTMFRNALQRRRGNGPQKPEVQHPPSEDADD